VIDRQAHNRAHDPQLLPLEHAPRMAFVIYAARIAFLLSVLFLIVWGMVIVYLGVSAISEGRWWSAAAAALGALLAYLAGRLTGGPLNPPRLWTRLVNAAWDRPNSPAAPHRRTG